MDQITCATFPVLDHGFVRVMDVVGDDSSIVQTGTRFVSDRPISPSNRVFDFTLSRTVACSHAHQVLPNVRANPAGASPTGRGDPVKTVVNTVLPRVHQEVDAVAPVRPPPQQVDAPTTIEFSRKSHKFEERVCETRWEKKLLSHTGVGRPAVQDFFVCVQGVRDRPVQERPFREAKGNVGPPRHVFEGAPNGSALAAGPVSLWMSTDSFRRSAARCPSQG
jgi:hypothetical protein